MKKSTVVLAVCVGLSACAGRTPNPVQSYQLGDDRKSCAALKAELANTEADILRKVPEADKTGQNVALGVAGAFFIVPWFFMDLSKADQVELEALRRRYNNLVILASEKECGFDVQPIQDPSKLQTQEAKQPASPSATPAAIPVTPEPTRPQQEHIEKCATVMECQSRREYGS